MKNLTMIVLGVISLLALCLVFSSFSVFADSAKGNVTIQNTAPTMGTVTLLNQAGADAAITPTVSKVVVTASATVTDANGGASVSNASGTLYHSSSTSAGADDENIHITNATCGLSGAAGTDVVVTCKFTMDFMALDGTWTANITAVDDASAQVSGIDPNTVNQITGIDVIEATIDYGSLQLGANSSATVKTMTLKSQGNVVLDAQFSGDNSACTVGEIPVGNTKYGHATASYDELATALSVDATTQAGLDLGIQGVATADGVVSQENEYWGIKVPTSGVSGTCSNTLTVTGIISAV